MWVRRFRWQTSGRLVVGGIFRSDIKQEGVSAQWTNLIPYYGFICHVSDGVGSDVHVSPYAGCSNKVVMPNPALFLYGGAVATNFEFTEVLPDRVVVTGQPQISCTLHDDSVILQGGIFYRLDKRFSFYENTPTNPLRSGRSCIARNEINARSCRLAKYRIQPVPWVAN